MIVDGLFEAGRMERYQRHAEDGGWIGVDFDGTLAEYHGWTGVLEFGAPIPRMVERVRAWVSMGIEVRIFTARFGDDVKVCSVTNSHVAPHQVDEAIGDWTEDHVGTRLRCTFKKDLHMIELWDDRAVQVMPNTGLTVAEHIALLELSGSEAEKVAEFAALAGKP